MKFSCPFGILGIMKKSRITQDLQEINSFYPKIFVSAERTFKFVEYSYQLPEALFGGYLIEPKTTVTEQSYYTVAESGEGALVSKVSRPELQWNSFSGTISEPGYKTPTEFTPQQDLAIEIFAGLRTSSARYEYNESSQVQGNVITDSFYDSNNMVGVVHTDSLIVSPSASWAVNKETGELAWKFLTDYNGSASPIEGPSGTGFYPAISQRYMVMGDWLKTPEHVVIIDLEDGNAVYKGNPMNDFGLTELWPNLWYVAFLPTLDPDVFIGIFEDMNDNYYHGYLITIDGTTVTFEPHPQEGVVFGRPTDSSGYMWVFVGETHYILDVPNGYYYVLDPDEDNNTGKNLHKLDKDHNIEWSSPLPITAGTNFAMEWIAYQGDSIYYFSVDNPVPDTLVVREYDVVDGTFLDYTFPLTISPAYLYAATRFTSDGNLYIAFGDGSLYPYVFSHATKTLDNYGGVAYPYDDLLNNFAASPIVIDKNDVGMLMFKDISLNLKLLSFDGAQVGLINLGEDYLEFDVGRDTPLPTADKEGRFYFFEEGFYPARQLLRTTTDTSKRLFRQPNPGYTLKAGEWYTRNSEWESGEILGQNSRLSSYGTVVYNNTAYISGLVTGLEFSTGKLLKAPLTISQAYAYGVTLPDNDVIYYARFWSGGVYSYNLATQQDTQITATEPTGQGDTSAASSLFLRNNGDIIAVTGAGRSTLVGTLRTSVHSFSGGVWTTHLSGTSDANFTNHEHGFAYDAATDSLYGINVDNDLSQTLTTIFKFNWSTNVWDIFDQQTTPDTPYVKNASYRFSNATHAMYNGVIYTPGHLSYDTNTQVLSVFMPPNPPDFMMDYPENTNFIDHSTGLFHRVYSDGSIYITPLAGDTVSPY